APVPSRKATPDRWETRPDNGPEAPDDGPVSPDRWEMTPDVGPTRRDGCPGPPERGETTPERLDNGSRRENHLRLSGRRALSPFARCIRGFITPSYGHRRGRR